jgi:tRNA 2-selenouridine synthase
MKQIISVDFYFQNLEHIPLIDVRSPGEFAKDIFQMLLMWNYLSMKERAVVGTAYKQESKKEYIEIGFEYVNPN